MSTILANPNNGIVEQGAGIQAILSPPGADLNANQAPTIIATSAVLISLSTIAVILRFIARHLSRAGLWWDDWTILLSLVCLQVSASVCGGEAEAHMALDLVMGCMHIHTNM